jgi:putative phosphoribosyl transferase
MESRFTDRHEAGKYLAEKLTEYANRSDVIVMALPRGGVPVAYEVAQALNAPLDIFLVRKLGVPGHEELAMGAIASGGVRIVNPSVVRQLHISEDAINAVASEELRELERREAAYRGSRPEPDMQGKTIILVDDGLATGASMWAAVAALRKRNPQQIVVAVPTASEETCDQFKHYVDNIVCAMTPEPFYAVGLWYHDFSQTSDAEVRQLLSQAEREGFGKAGRSIEIE